MWIDDQRVEKLLERPHSVGQNRANSQERPALLLSYTAVVFWPQAVKRMPAFTLQKN